MNAVDRNFQRMSGRIRALEQLVTVLLIDWAERGEGDASALLAAAHRNSILTLQMQERPVDDATDLEAGALADALNEIFENAKRHLQ